MERVRKDLYALDNEELFPGLVAAAVPILDSQSQMIGTVAVNATNTRVTAAAIVDYVPLLKEAAATIGRVHQR